MEEGIVAVAYRGYFKVYEFTIARDGPAYKAVCHTKLGPIQATARRMDRLLTVEVPAIVRKWESR